MKKLISIGVAIALLTMVVVPVGVAADYPDDPGTWSKTPFGIFGTGIKLVGDIVDAIPTIADMLPFDVPDVTDPVGEYLGVNLAWMTDMTAWSMVTVGDVIKTADPVISGVAELPIDLGDVADIFYVVGARLWDPWDEYEGDSTLPDVIIDNFPPGIDLPV